MPSSLLALTLNFVLIVCRDRFKRCKDSWCGDGRLGLGELVLGLGLGRLFTVVAEGWYLVESSVWMD